MIEDALETIEKAERHCTGRHGQQQGLSQLEKSRLVLDYIKLRCKPDQNRTYKKLMGMVDQEMDKIDLKEKERRKKRKSPSNIFKRMDYDAGTGSRSISGVKPSHNYDK